MAIMKRINLHILADKTPKAEKLRKFLMKSFKNFPVKASDYVVVIGGDGFMLDSLKKYQKFKKPFYGINTGNRGFLLNKFIHGNLISKIRKSSEIFLFPLEAKIKTQNKVKKINEFSNEISEKEDEIITIKKEYGIDDSDFDKTIASSNTDSFDEEE